MPTILPMAYARQGCLSDYQRSREEICVSSPWRINMIGNVAVQDGVLYGSSAAPIARPARPDFLRKRTRTRAEQLRCADHFSRWSAWGFVRPLLSLRSGFFQIVTVPAICRCTIAYIGFDDRRAHVRAMYRLSRLRHSAPDDCRSHKASSHFWVNEATTFLRSRSESVGHSHARHASRISRIQFVRMRQVHIGEHSVRHCRCGRSATSPQTLLLAERIVCSKAKAIGARRCNTILINAGADPSQNSQRAERTLTAAKSPAYESLCAPALFSAVLNRWLASFAEYRILSRG
jgi:hypothetical protein